LKFLVLGGTGLLGEALIDRCRARGCDAIPASRFSRVMALDVTDRRQLGAVIEEAKPDVVINSAALAGIDACEADPEMAHAVNAAPVAELVKLSRGARFKLVHISTDHFFTGGGRTRHDESAPVALLNEYARSKFAAERFASVSPSALVVRTAFVGRASSRDHGFAEQIYGLLKNGKTIVLFEDAYTSLLHRSDVAETILRLVEREVGGVINVASADVFSKADLIRGFADRLGLPLNAQSGSVTSLGTVRAESLGLDVSKVEALLGDSMPSFDDTADLMAGDFRG
jgi:dTDP-4-dehydrorhamnose reductase